MTNNQIAKSLGWNLEQRQAGPLPHFTTSLDAIVAEARALGKQGLEWVIQHIGNEAELKNNVALFADPRAWCRGVLAYLKEPK